MKKKIKKIILNILERRNVLSLSRINSGVSRTKSMKRGTFNDLLKEKYIEENQLLNYVYLDTCSMHYYSFYKYQRSEHTFNIAMVDPDCHQIEYWSNSFDENKIKTLSAIYLVMQSWDACNQKVRKHDISKDFEIVNWILKLWTERQKNGKDR